MCNYLVSSEISVVRIVFQNYKNLEYGKRSIRAKYHLLIKISSMPRVFSCSKFNTNIFIMYSNTLHLLWIT